MIEFYNYMRFASDNLERIKKEGELFELFMNCKTQREISAVERKWRLFMEVNPHCFLMEKQARKRVYRIEKQKRESWRLQVN